MMIVGVTGGIGSGKTTVCKLFEKKGIPVYNADERAKALYGESGEIKEAVIELLGEKAYRNGKPDREYIASKVFADKELLKKLNAVIHPAVGIDFQNWKRRNTRAAYVIKEAAVMIESGSYEQTDRLLVITAPEKLRIERVVERDKTSREQVKSRIKNQMTDSERLRYADHIIVNDGSKPLEEQVDKLHEEFMKAVRN